MNALPRPLVVAVDKDGRTVLVDDTAPRTADTPTPYESMRLFAPVDVPPGQMTL